MVEKSCHIVLWLSHLCNLTSVIPLHINCTSWQLMDIYTTDFEKYLATLSLSSSPNFTSVSTTPAPAPPPLCLVLGTHLCGHLSTRLVSVFSSPACEHLPVLILSPCCMPHKKKDKEIKKKDKEKRQQVEKDRKFKREQQGVMKITEDENTSTTSRLASLELPFASPAPVSTTAILPSPLVTASEEQQPLQLQVELLQLKDEKLLRQADLQTLSLPPTCTPATIATATGSVDAGADARTLTTSATLTKSKSHRRSTGHHNTHRDCGDPYMNWCMTVLLLLPTSDLRRDIKRDTYVLSEKDIFITAVRKSALAIAVSSSSAHHDVNSASTPHDTIRYDTTWLPTNT
mgnify:FL=1